MFDTHDECFTRLIILGSVTKITAEAALGLLRTAFNRLALLVSFDPTNRMNSLCLRRLILSAADNARIFAKIFAEISAITFAWSKVTFLSTEVRWLSDIARIPLRNSIFFFSNSILCGTDDCHKANNLYFRVRIYLNGRNTMVSSCGNTHVFSICSPPPSPVRSIHKYSLFLLVKREYASRK